METPILLLVYNRPKQTERVLSRLRECGVKKVYVSADGPKNSHDQVQTDKVRSLIKGFEFVEKTRFSNSNYGCKNGVISGIDWFFDHDTEGIILEDDCLPSTSAFDFLNGMLIRYRNNEQIGMISASNPLGSWNCEGGHFLSAIGHVWGWGTWKNRWSRFNPELPSFLKFVDSNGFERIFGPTTLANSRRELTWKSLSGKIDTWDYQWSTHLLMTNQLAVIPEKNLVENIGSGNDATHTKAVPHWINNSVKETRIQIEDRSVIRDLEYEMEVDLTRRTNSTSAGNSRSYMEQGRTGSGKLKIALINSSDLGGGAEKIAFTLHERLLSAGHSVKLLVESKKTDALSIEKLQDNWVEQLRNSKPDIIHAHNLHGTKINLKDLTELSSEIPMVFTLHDSWLTTGSEEHPFILNTSELNLIVRRKWSSLLVQRKNALESKNIRFTAPSQWMRERFYEVHGIRPFFVPNAIEKASFSDTQIPSDRYILFIANRPETNPYKDYDILIDSWRLTNKKLGRSGCDLIVVGGSLSEVIIEGKTLFSVGKKSSSEVLLLLRNALALVQASKQDNAPLTILEAHASGTKVIGSLVGGIPELVGHDERQWLSLPENVNDLAEKLEIAIRSDVKYEAPAHPTVDEVVDTYLGHYLDMINA